MCQTPAKRVIPLTLNQIALDLVIDTLTIQEKAKLQKQDIARSSPLTGGNSITAQNQKMR